MHHELDEDFVAVAAEILGRNLSPEDWAPLESCDMFQRGAYCGGFDADEMEFTFSHFQKDGKEVWFQLSLAQLNRVVERRLTTVEARLADP